MDNPLLQRLKDAISKSDRIAIAVGRNPVVDDMAAALSLYLALEQTGKKPMIASTTQPLVEHSSLVGVDKIKSQFEGGAGDLVVSFPYKEGEIEKVSYTIESGLLNIVVKAGQQGLTFQESDVRFTRGGGVPQLLFIVGTARLSDLGSLFNPDTLKDTQIVNIDNKRDNQGFGDIVMVNPQASSVSEEMANVLMSLGVDLDIDIAQNLFSGIVSATESFQSPSTSPSAFEMAGILMKKGAQRVSTPPAYPRPQAQAQTQRPMPQPQFGSQNQQAQPPQQQNEERVSSFMPEQSLAGTGAGVGAPQFPRVRPQGQRQQFGQPQSQPQTPQQNDGRGQQPRRQTPPSDWLTPKVYKGSSNVS